MAQNQALHLIRAVEQEANARHAESEQAFGDDLRHEFIERLRSVVACSEQHMMRLEMRHAADAELLQQERSQLRSETQM